jgi:hypothetical protein
MNAITESVGISLSVGGIRIQMLLGFVPIVIVPPRAAANSGEIYSWLSYGDAYSETSI